MGLRIKKKVHQPPDVTYWLLEAYVRPLIITAQKIDLVLAGNVVAQGGKWVEKKCVLCPELRG